MLFDGGNLDAWVSQKDRQWEDSDGPADWKILKGGTLEVVPGTGSLITKKRFRDFKLHLEYRLTNEKTNGGVFLMARYELGIKNGEGKGKDPQYGCAFENLQKPLRPIAPALKPGAEWQTLDVDFRSAAPGCSGKTSENARATVLLNGIKIHDNVELGPRKGAAKRLGDASTRTSHAARTWHRLRVSQYLDRPTFQKRSLGRQSADFGWITVAVLTSRQGRLNVDAHYGPAVDALFLDAHI